MKRSRLRKAGKAEVKKAIEHLKHDIVEQESGIKRDQRTIVGLRKLL